MNEEPFFFRVYESAVKEESGLDHTSVDARVVEGDKLAPLSQNAQSMSIGRTRVLVGRDDHVFAHCE